MTRSKRCSYLLIALLVLASPLLAQQAPERPDTIRAKHFRHADLDGQDVLQDVHSLPLKAASHQRLTALGAPDAGAFVDARSGRFATLLLSEPMIPGPGVGNRLTWEKAATAGPGEAAWAAVQAYLRANEAALGVDVDELGDPRITVYSPEKIHIHAQRMLDGVAVDDTYVKATLSQGNMVLLGAHKWADRGATRESFDISAAAAEAAARGHAGEVSGSWGKTDRVFVVMYNGNAGQGSQGYRYVPAWSVKLSLQGDAGSWEARIDARDGSLISFEDKNAYSDVVGGVYPVSNDGIVPDGVEQAGWPMPFADVNGETTTTGGVFSSTATVTTDFYGPYVNINDNCGTSSLTGSIYLDWGTSGGIDCTTPGFGGAGNTHASRTGFYELNKMIEMARGQLPSNSWLQSRLTSNMNINNTCNAFWNGTVNFYRSGGGCTNTGEIAGVFDHEWGHGMDANDATPGIASPSGEGIADIYTALRLNSSCIGRNFRLGTNCSGNGDPCLECDGVRDIDYLKKQSGQPHDYSWSNATCGGQVHCVGHVYSEAVWSLWKRELPGTYGYDNNTAWEIANRLTFIGAGNTGTWFSGGPPNGGCGGSSGYMNYLAADDDNGNINDGTPHMQAIYTSFNDQEIACQTPSPTDSGCSGVPTSAPSVTGTPSNNTVDLSWGPVAGATSYEVFRTEGVFACDFGKVKLGSTTGTTWSDTGLQNGRTYSYVVIGKSGASCFGPASSCTNVVPAAGPGVTIDVASAAHSFSGGDGDAYLDNCEDGTTTFDIINSGLGGLTGVTIASVTPSNAGVSITGSSVTPSSLGEGATAVGSFSYTAGGLSAGEDLTFTVEVTANEMSGSKLADITILSTETDLTFTPSTTYSFESGTEGWTTIQGTFNRENGGGAGGTTWYEQSSANLANQCDQIQSPVMVFSSTTTLSLSTNYDIEPQYTNGEWYDRANIGIVDVASGTRSLVSPDSGRAYNATGVNGTCGTSGQDGWADTAASWASSGFSAAALGSAGLDGTAVQFDVRYGTDPALHGTGFRFDEVTVNDVYFQGADTQSDTCGGPICTVDADCDDGAFCNGAETCVAGNCQAGTPPNCDDGVSCTDDACNEGTDSCDNTANDANCDNGAWCDGAETCDPVLDCQAGTPPNCDDGVGCTVDTCNEGADACDNTPDDAACDNGLFCDGAETCDPSLDCQAGTPPNCPFGCDEVGDVCFECAVDADCDDGLFCNGVETCNAGSCVPGSDPCPGETCDEAGDVCGCAPKGASCTVDADCCSNKCRGKSGAMTCK